MNIELPDGTILEDIPEGTTQAQLRAKLEANGYDVTRLGPSQAEPLGNEGRRVLPKSTAPAAEKPEGTNRKLFKALLGDSLGAVAGDFGAGVGKAVSGAVNATEDLVPPLALIKTMRGGRRSPMAESLSQYANESYKEAGPVAAGGKVLGEIALTGGPSNAAAQGVGSLIKGTTLLPRALRTAAESATAGATSGALVGPEEGATRAGNAVQGAATGLALSPVAAAAGKGYQAASNFLKGGTPQAIAARAGQFFEKTLGKDKLKTIEAQLQNPAEIPMSTAALAGDDAMGSLERVSRRRSTPLENEKWLGLDTRTNKAVGEKLNAAVGDDIANLQPRAEEVKATLQEAQNALNRVPLKQGARDELADELLALRNRPEFENNTQAQKFINDFVGNFNNPSAKRTVGGLAHFETDLAQNTSLSPKAREAIWGVIRKHIDANGGGAWSEAYNIRSELQKQLAESASANAILGDFNSAFGRGKGKLTSEGEPLYAADQIRKSINARGETKGVNGADPVDLLNPKTRQALTEVEDLARVAGLPARGRGGENLSDSPWGAVVMGPGGLPISDYKTRMLAEMLRRTARAVGADRGDKVRQASNLALQDPTEFRKVLDQLEKSKEITASQAASLARILRGSGTAAGTTANDY